MTQVRGSSDSRRANGRGSAGRRRLGARSRAAVAALGSRLPRRSLAVLVTALTAGLLCSAPALAISQRGHAFSFSFGGQGVSPAQFQHPSAVAVNSNTGDVYVADRNNGRVEEFAPELKGSELVGEKFLREFAVPYPVYLAVDNSAGPSAGDVYVVGAKPEDKNEPEPEEFDIYKFSGEGAPITKLTKIKIKTPEFEEEFEEVRGVAVDATTGALFVYQEEEIFVFNDEVKNAGVGHVVSEAAEARSGLAVDSQDHFYVGSEEAVGATDKEEEQTLQNEEEGILNGLFSEGGFGIVSKLKMLDGKIERPELDPEDTTAVAVNPAEEAANEVSELNDVYIDNLTSLAGEPATTVAAFTPAGALIQRFSAPALHEGTGVAVDSKTGAVFVSDGFSDRVDVFALEKSGRPQVDALSSQSVSPPPSASNATLLSAEINPSGSDTHYFFEYGSASCSAGPPSCTKTPLTDLGFSGFGDRAVSTEVQNLPTGLYHYRVTAENAAGPLASSEQTFTIRALASGLPDGRAWELVTPPEKNGAEPTTIGSFSNGGAIQASANGHAMAYVADGPMPAGAEPEGVRNPEPTQIFSSRSASGWASRDIDTPNNAPAGVGSGVAPEYELFSSSLALGLVEPFLGAPHSGGLAEPPLSPPLSEEEKGKQEKTIYLRADEPVQPEGEETESFDQARLNGEHMTPQNPGFLALVTKMNAPGGEPFGGGGGEPPEGFQIEGASPNLQHVVFASRTAAPGLYEWSAGGALHLVSELPKKAGRLTPAQAALGSDKASDVRDAVSDGGTRVVWSGFAGGPVHLYVRDTASEETVQLDAVQAKASGIGNPAARFQTASADGTKVFFTDSQRLTSDSKATANGQDLYVATLSGGGNTGSPLSVALKDLTPEGTRGEAGDVLVEDGQGGGVLGASDDGDSVYFVANGVLTEAANAEGEKATLGKCQIEENVTLPGGTTCNLYERHYNGTVWLAPKFIAALSVEDQPDWGASSVPQNLTEMTARVSPNGEHLAFMSDRPLTGYDNVDASPEAEGARDEEVFLYDASSERLVCASCNPSGAQPKGVDDTPASSDTGALLVDGPKIWNTTALGVAHAHWLAGSVPGWIPVITGVNAFYQPRYLSDNGRLFFNSPDALVPAAQGDKEKVYEYSPDGLGSCQNEAGCVGLISSPTADRESAFLDASTSGNDVFFLTANQLAQEDVDDGYDIYDAHVCEAASPCLPAPASGQQTCKSEQECRPGGPEGPSPFEAPASTNTAGPGNIAQGQVLPSKEGGSPKPKPTPKPLTRAQKLTRALKTCRTKFKAKSKKGKRVACEKQARKLYGAKKAGKAKKAAHKSSARRGAR